MFTISHDLKLRREYIARIECFLAVLCIKMAIVVYLLAYSAI